MASEIKTKERLNETGVDVKSACSHMDIVSTCSLVEDSWMFESFEPDIKKVKFPLEGPETFLRDCPKINMLKEKTPMKDASMLLRDDNTCHEDATSVLSMFSSLLKLPSNDEIRGKNSNYESVLSPTIINFAENSRVRSGERLLKRSITHAMDKATPDVIDGFISTGTCDNEMVIMFDNMVKPSMTKGMHNTKMCFDSNSIMGSTCDCKSGCKIDESLMDRHHKNLCTHSLSLIVSLYACLHDGLATRLLVECRMRMNEDEDVNKCENNVVTGVRLWI